MCPLRLYKDIQIKYKKSMRNLLTQYRQVDNNQFCGITWCSGTLSLDPICIVRKSIKHHNGNASYYIRGLLYVLIHTKPICKYIICTNINLLKQHGLKTTVNIPHFSI